MNNDDLYFAVAQRLANGPIGRSQLLEACQAAGAQIIIKERDRGDGRKAHYGPGEQPWDTTLKLGWGPHAAAAHVLRYLRRDKAVEHSLQSARVYYGWLKELANEDLRSDGSVRGIDRFFGANETLIDLDAELSAEERGRLDG